MLFKYNIFGYDKEGYNRKGFDKNGFDRSGYDKDGYNKDGYDANGYDRLGYDLRGYDKSGYDKQGFDSTGYNANGFDRKGFDHSGFDKDGYDKDGYDANGYDRLGYDLQGYNIDGYDIKGFDKLGFDHSGFDRNGYDKKGYDADGYDQLGYDLNGYDRSGYDRNGKRFVHDDKIIELTKKTYKKRNKENLKELGDSFDGGLYGVENYELARYIYEIAKGKNVRVSEQYYYAPTQAAFQKNDNSFGEIFNQEKSTLKRVKTAIENDISKTTEGIEEVEKETWWMDYDQKNEWRVTAGRNRKKEDKIFFLQKIKKRPYYARMDTKTEGEISTAYIGEEHYDSEDGTCCIASVWSEIGRRYREKRNSSFQFDGKVHEIQLRRNLEIQNGELIDVYDEYNVGSEAATNNITDLYLLKVLEEKKGEKNITNIIRSIQLNQNAIIEYDFQKNLLVQGCAGSGKTMILLHRLANMKFNYPDVDYTRVKIITPNKNFNLFIDELSKNLHIEQIPKMTIGEYWIDVVSRYRVAHTKDKSPMPYSLEDLLTDDFSKEVREIIYSKEFANVLKTSIEKIPKGLDYTQDGTKKKEDGSTEKKEGSIRKIDNAIEEALCSFGLRDIKVADRKENNKTNHMDLTDSILYAKVLALFLYYGPLSNIYQDTYLCVDEGQDISLLQYGLMLRINRNNVKFNIYGDIYQQIPSGCNIEDWDYLLKYIQAEKFVLNENYRNSEEIIQFYNQKLSMSNLSFGLKTKEVEKISHKTLIWKVLLNLILGNRTAIICNDYNLIPNDIKEFCSFNDLSATNKANVLTVKQAKGLEYDTVFVFDKDMNKNESYISYTRALSELYIVE